MTSRVGRMIGALSLLLVFAVTSGASAQEGQAPLSTSTRYLRGQSVQPVFEGWEQNADGTYSMWFGYLNRNWEQRLDIPVGPNNGFAPGDADRGQPTVFYTAEKKRQMFAFRVVLPADWPKERDIVWTLTANGVMLKATGSLWPVWMVDFNVISANRGGQRDTDTTTTNLPPVITETPGAQLTVAVGAPLTLTTGVSDDEMPKVTPPKEGDVPMRQALRVNWIHWRGPGTVKFNPESARVVDAAGKQTFKAGKATTVATFDKPGVYQLKAYAEDLSLFAMPPNITVTVTGSGSAQH